MIESFIMTKHEMLEWINLVWASRKANMNAMLEDSLRTWQRDNLDARDTLELDGTWRDSDTRTLRKQLFEQVQAAFDARKPDYSDRDVESIAIIFDRHYRRYVEGFYNNGCRYEPGKGIVWTMMG